MVFTTSQRSLLAQLADRMKRKQLMSKDENTHGAELLNVILNNAVVSENNEEVIKNRIKPANSLISDVEKTTNEIKKYTGNTVRLKRGDVIAVDYQHKTRPGLIIKINKTHVYALLLSSQLDSPYKLMDGNSRIFGASVITTTLIPLQIEYAEKYFLCQYDNSKLVVEATKAFNRYMKDVFSHNIKGVTTQEKRRRALKIA